MELSICITIKDRSKIKTSYGDLLLFQNCVKSIKESVNADNVEVIIVDYYSTDYPLNEWVQKELGDINCEIIQLDEKFSRGRSLNLAAENSNGEYLFFLDADMLISENVINTGLKYLSEGKSFFPICFSYKDHTHKTGWWRSTGWGMSMVKKTIWELCKIPEYYNWGNEDGNFRNNIKNHVEIVRENCDGLYHQWHPTTSDSLAGGLQQKK